MRITSVTGGEKCHSGGILFKSSTVLSRNKMLSDTWVVVHQELRDYFYADFSLDI
jgi:hypothetical protein